MFRWSFVIPVFNVKPDYLKQCLDSILINKSEMIEVIVVDDCSTNGCEIVCDDYQKQDSRVKVYHLIKNGGVSNARNHGISVSSGD